MGVLPRFAISPAHATQSWIESWFSLVRLMGFDEAVKYVAGVANRRGKRREKGGRHG